MLPWRSQDLEAMERRMPRRNELRGSLDFG